MKKYNPKEVYELDFRHISQDEPLNKVEFKEFMLNVANSILAKKKRNLNIMAIFEYFKDDAYALKYIEEIKKYIVVHSYYEMSEKDLGDKIKLTLKIPR